MSRVRKKRYKMDGKVVTPWQDMWFRLRRNKPAIVGLVFIILILLLAIFADVIADYETQVIDIHPAERLQPPSKNHIFGTDSNGRDIFYRVVHGARYSLSFGVGCTLVGLIFGSLLGAASAFFGGKVDTVITFIIDTIICIPGTLMSLSLITVLGPGFLNLIIAMSITSIPGNARYIRGLVLRIVGQEYVEAARSIGAGSLRTIIVHVLPNTIGLIIVNATMNVAVLILSATGLSFLGFGVQPPAPEWGAMLNGALTYLRSHPHTIIFPGLAILVTALSFNLLGDGLSEALDPRMKE